MTRRDLLLVVAASWGSGFLAYWALDRITFLTGDTVRDVRYAGRTA